jgi:outer membrane protein assembly factor BamB
VSWAIGIDFGTSRSAGAIGELDPRRLAADAASGRPLSPIAAPTVSPLEIEGNRWIPSMVLRTPEGELVVGAAADNLAGVHPDRLERTPKRALGTSSPLLLGGTPIDPRDAAAAVIRVIVAEGRLRAGTDPAGCIITHPVRWAGVRRAALAEAATRAGIEHVQLVDEPVAAAIHYASEHVDLGARVGVYDLGGGTFDTALLQRTDRGFEVIGVPGGDENIGGEDFDHRLFRYFGSCLAETDQALWEQLMNSDDRKWKRAALDLLVQARRAKEALSSYTSTQVFVPVADRDIVVNRSQFEAMIIDDVERTMDLMEDTITEAGLAIDDLAAVFLVGGSSRVPLVAQMATERFGTRVVTRDEPKGVVALGAARLAALRFLAPRPAAARAGAGAERPATAPAAAPAPDEAPTAPTAAPTEDPLAPASDAAPPVADDRWLESLPVPQPADRLGARFAASASAAVAKAANAAAARAATWGKAGHPSPPPPGAPVTQPWASAPPPTAAAGTPDTASANDAQPWASAPPPVVAAARAPTTRVPTTHDPAPWASAPPPTAAAGTGAAATGYPAVKAGQPLPAPAPAAPAPASPAPASPAPVQVAPAPAAPVTIAWRVALGEAPGQLAADIDAVVLSGLSGVVRCIDPRRGELRWQQSLGAPSWCAPALADDAVVIGSSSGHVSLLDRATGAVRWRTPVGAAIVCTPVVIGPVVIVGHDGGQLVALERANGALRWTLPVGAAVRAGLVVNGSDVIVATTAGQVFAVYAPTGQPRWGYNRCGQVLLTPAVVGDKVLVPSRDGIVHGLRLADGLAEWGIRCAGSPATPVAAAGGLFAVVDEQGFLRVHRADTGQSLTEAQLGQANDSAGQPAGVVLVPSASPTLAVVETGGSLTAIDLATKAARFTVPTGDGNRSVPVASGGLVCVGTTFGQLYGIVAP